ncbi:DUF4149 domain-containing protein [Citrus sinensis]|nr:DUF4149 domain-containing protein [Citrus sinensis]
MNLVAICLVASSLAAGRSVEEVIVMKEGHRVVVVEYDEHGRHNTKVSISPPDHDRYHIPKTASPASDIEEKMFSAAADALNNAEDTIKQASSLLPDIGQGSKPYDKGAGPGELICDAYGKCKHKIAGALEKAKGSLSGASHEVPAPHKGTAHEAKEVLSKTGHDFIDTKKKMDCEAKDAVRDAYGKAKETASDKAHEAKEAAKDALGKAKETASQKAYEARENLKDARAIGTTIRGDIARNVSEQVENVCESVEEKAKEARQGTEHAAKWIGQYSYGFLRYLGIPETLNALMGVINLLGFSTAYGMSVWVTFISSYVLAGALPRHQFGMVQSKIYPVYFRDIACSIGWALLGHMPQLFSTKAGMFQGFNLLASILMVLINSIYLEPLATKVMFERMKVEKEEGKGRESQIGETSRVTETEQGTATERRAEGPAPVPVSPGQEELRTKMVKLSERLKTLNTYSSILNLITLMSLTWHLVYLGQSLHTTCY